MRSEEFLINNISRPHVSPIHAHFCSSFFCRLRGLTFRRDLGPSDGLLLVQRRENRIDASIHMLFVWMDLAVVWINSEKVVVDVKHARKWSLIYTPKAPALYILEANLERLKDFVVGDRIGFEEHLVG